MKYCIVTFGCRTNQADSFDIERDLRARGGEASSLDAANLVVVNTCAVTAAAEQAARQALRRVRRLNPAARLVVTGCYTRRAAAELQAITGSADSVKAGVSPRSEPPARMPGPGTRGRTIYLLRVQTGCDQACSYCIVPHTRGPGRSVPPERVSAEVTDAAAAGFQEVMLTGVHLGSYGRDLIPSTTLADLVVTLARHPSDVRFRMSAVEPMDVDERLVEALVGSGRVAPHFHLPLQHASDRLLAAMRRPYTSDDYARRLDRLRDAFPDAALGSDIMVGFPGETHEDFERCLEYVTRSTLTYLHVFPFSPRPGTSAAVLPGRPHPSHVRDRVTRLRRVGDELNRRFRRRFVGKTVEGLTIEDGSLVLTDNYLRVRIGTGLKRNERVTVKILADGRPMAGLVMRQDDQASN